MTEGRLDEEALSEIRHHKDLIMRSAACINEILNGSGGTIDFVLRESHPHDPRFATILTLKYETVRKRNGQ